MGTLLISILAAIGFLSVGWWIGGKLKEVKLSKIVESIGDKMSEEASEVIDKVKKLMK